MTFPIDVRRALSVLAAAVAAIAVPCVAHAQAAEPGAVQWPQWVTEAMQQENARLRTSKVEFEDGAIRTRLAGKPVGDPQRTEDGWYVGSNIGTDAPLECWVFSDVVDPASTASSLAEVNLQAVADAYGPVRDRGVFFVDAGAYDGNPWLALEWLYAVGEPPQKRLGLIKVRVAIDQERSYACMHNSLGYRDTFAAAFEQFVREAKVPRPAAQPYYDEIVLQKIGGRAVGISRSTFTRDAEGDTKIMTVQSSLLPVDASTVQTSDSWNVVFAQPDGTLINQQYVRTENGELTVNLSLGPDEEGAWWIAGTFQGKEIEHAIDSAGQPMSELGQMLAVRELLADPQRTATRLSIWAPEADPTQFLDAEVALDVAARDQGRARLNLGGLEIAAQFDRTGSLLNGTMQLGAAQVTMERVWAKGSVL